MSRYNVKPVCVQCGGENSQEHRCANTPDAIAKLRERVTELEKHCDREANIMDCLQADIAQRDAEIAELRKDRERLDWLLAKDYRMVYMDSIRQNHYATGIFPCDGKVKKEGAGGYTPREAIDAAIEAAKARRS